MPKKSSINKFQIIGIIMIVASLVILFVSIANVNSDKYKWLQIQEMRYKGEISQAQLDKYANKYKWLDGAHDTLIKGWAGLYRDAHSELVKMRIYSGAGVILFFGLFLSGILIIIFKRDRGSKDNKKSIPTYNYSILSEQDFTNYVYINSPVRLERISIVQDINSKRKFVKFKLCNIANEIIDNVSIKLSSYDVTGLELENIDELVLSGLSVKPNDYFGENELVSVSDNRISSVNLTISRVAMKSGKEWTVDDNTSIVKADEIKKIAFDDDLNSQLEIESRENGFSLNCLFDETEQYWRCSCGHVNTIDQDNCYYCESSYKVLKDCFSKKYLSEHREEYLEKEKEKKYKEAMGLLHSNDVDKVLKAKQLFIELEDWQDSSEYIGKSEEKYIVLKEKKNDKKATLRKRIIIAATCILAVIIAGMVVRHFIIQNTINTAKEYYSKRKYAEAIKTLDDAFLKNSSSKELENKYIISYVNYLADNNDIKELNTIIEGFKNEKLYGDMFDCGEKLFKKYNFKSAYTIWKELPTNYLNKKINKKYYINKAKKMKYKDWLGGLLQQKFWSKKVDYKLTGAMAKEVGNDDLLYASNMLSDSKYLDKLVNGFINKEKIPMEACRDFCRKKDVYMDTTSIITFYSHNTDSGKLFNTDFFDVTINSNNDKTPSMLTIQTLNDTRESESKKAPSSMKKSKMLNKILKLSHTSKKKIKQKIEMDNDFGIPSRRCKKFTYSWKSKGREYECIIQVDKYKGKWAVYNERIIIT